MKLMIINAPADAAKAQEMKLHLSMMRRNGLIELVDDVGAAQVVCVLMSNALLDVDEPMAVAAWTASENAKRRHAAGNCRLVPVLVETMAELPDHLVTLVSLPRHGKPAKSGADWAGIASELRALAMAKA